jgi:hypothetical protein
MKNKSKRARNQANGKSTGRDDMGRFIPGNEVAKEVVIDWEQAAHLAGIFCTGEEIAEFFGVSYKTMVRRCEEEQTLPFGEWLAQKRGAGKIRLRRAQYLAATGEKGLIKNCKTLPDGTVIEMEKEVYLVQPSISMQIWLGKNWLGQSDRIEAEITRPQRLFVLKVHGSSDPDEIEE